MKAWEATDPTMTADFLVDLIREEQVKVITGQNSSCCCFPPEANVLAHKFQLPSMPDLARYARSAHRSGGSDEEYIRPKMKRRLIAHDMPESASLRPLSLVALGHPHFCRNSRYGVRDPATCGSVPFAP